MTGPRLEAFRLTPHGPVLAPSTADRAWMDAFPDRHAYRCLPLAIANAHAWELRAPGGFEIEWNGGAAAADLVVRPLPSWPDGLPLEHFAQSNFSRGIVTLHAGYLFRTPPGWNLLATGPFNAPRTGIYPLTGIIESDWLPYPFTMNWQMLEPGTHRFARDEAFCSIMPIPKAYLEGWEVAVHALGDDPVLTAEQDAFRCEREEFRARLRQADPEATRQAWQKHYFVGRFPDGTESGEHVNKVRLAQPVDRTGTRPLLAKTVSQSPAVALALAKLDAAAPPPSSSFPCRPDSILNDLDQQQDGKNRAGRERLNNGILRRSPQTLTVTDDLDPDSLDFIYAPGFVGPAECSLLVETALMTADRQKVEGISRPDCRGSVLCFDDVAAVRPDAATAMRRIQARITGRIAAFYGLTAPAYADTVQLVQWREGMFMSPHADRANSDGSAHGWPHRDFASIVYLNDDYDGGELYFPRLDMVVRPTAGMLLAFTGGWHHEHAVLLVRSGLRLTMAAFYTVDAAKRHAGFYSEF